MSNLGKHLGKHGKDVITGFEGTITSEHHYLTGCTQYGLQPKIKKDGTLGESNYFDETRVQISGEAIKLDVAVMQQGEQETVKKVTRKNGCDFRERP